MYAITHARIYTGFDILENHAVVIEGGIIKDICPMENIPAQALRHRFAGANLSAGFIDLQINGCGGVQFNDSVDAVSTETLDIMHHTNLASGCTSYLPTLITCSDNLIYHAIEVMRDYLTDKHNPRSALGLHLEGPYISMAKKGTHNAHFIRRPTATMINYLCQHAEVVKMITLAPEEVEIDYIHQLSEAGIIVSAGHSQATYQQTRQAYAAGISLNTHLFNAMPAITGRESGVIGAVYDSADVYSTIIADGYHVSFNNIRTAKKIKNDKLILTTDATAIAGSSLTQFTFAGKTIYYQNGMCLDEHGVLSGSALTMIKALENSVTHIGIALDEAIRMATLYPAKALGVDNQLGSISIDKIANIAIFDANFRLLATIEQGNLKTLSDN